ncbi:MAG TPA: glycerol-3-phosphate acyltransferase [Actinomycetota bacterium]|jgi:glycerol-3-phosphate acyltransferase PlsY
MTGRIAWVAAAYLVGTFPATFVIAKLKGAHGLLAAAGRDAGETDAHLLMTRYLGARWSSLAATTDVLKALLFTLAARAWGDLPPEWLAMVGVALVIGHAFPFYATQMAGRGMTATAGVLLVLLPWEMVLCGLIILAGIAVKNSGLASTIGLATVPIAAAVQGQPEAYVAMSVVILVLIMIRRLQGVGEVVASGVSPVRAVLSRCVLDATPAPGSQRRGASEPYGEQAPPGTV